MPILALIPARGGSKGVPRKNIRLLAGKPLLAYSIAAAMGSRYSLRPVVSTDDQEIAAVAREYGADVPFLRPPELAQDLTPMVPVVEHAIRFMEEQDGLVYDPIVLLQPTSPLREPRHIDGALEKFFDTAADSIIAVREAPGYWFQLLYLDSDRVRWVLPEMALKYQTRQEGPVAYEECGGIYVTRRRLIMEDHKIVGGDIRAVVMEEEATIDVDTEWDLWRAERCLAERSGRR